MTFLDASDLPATVGQSLGLTVEQMIADAEALAVLAAPCLVDPDTELTDDQTAAVKAILRGAIMRWSDAGAGAVQAENIGNYGYTLDTRQQRRGMFWPSEIEQLQKVCAGPTSGAFTIDTLCTSTCHADICAVNFGALYCSCGASLTLSGPLYEVCP